jgi:hypothetical protein
LKKTPVPALTLQNTMRRILENYFKILGGVDTYVLVGKFEGIEKVQCQSLISWVNDGSHYAPDELYVAIGENMAANYMKIFFKIFKAAQHEAHYKMMMGDDYVDLDPDELLNDAEDGIKPDVLETLDAGAFNGEEPSILMPGLPATTPGNPASIVSSDSGRNSGGGSDIPF